MKYLIIYLMSFSLGAQTIIDRVKDIKKEDVRLLMAKCGIRVANPALFMKKLTLVQLECMESKVGEARDEIGAVKTKMANKETAMKRLKTADCSQLSNQILKDLCTMYK